MEGSGEKRGRRGRGEARRVSRCKWRYLHLWKCRWQSQKWPEAKQCQAKKTAKCAEPTAIRAMKEAGSERDREREREREEEARKKHCKTGKARRILPV